MFKNPFSPIFGGRPGFFFGRDDILLRFETAMVALAGLPYACDQVIHHEGCTYMRRAAHVELGLFTWKEADDAFREAFRRIQGLSASGKSQQQLSRVRESLLYSGIIIAPARGQVAFAVPYLRQYLLKASGPDKNTQTILERGV